MLHSSVFIFSFLSSFLADYWKVMHIYIQNPNQELYKLLVEIEQCKGDYLSLEKNEKEKDQLSVSLLRQMVTLDKKEVDRGKSSS